MAFFILCSYENVVIRGFNVPNGRAVLNSV